MTTDQVLEVLKDRKLLLVIQPDGSPVVKGDKEAMTPTLLRVLKFHKDEIVKRLAPPKIMDPDAPAIEVRWNTGLIGRHWFPNQGWPVGAWWWRHQGEEEWKPIPGTRGEKQSEPRPLTDAEIIEALPGLPNADAS